MDVAIEGTAQEGKIDTIPVGPHCNNRDEYVVEQTAHHIVKRGRAPYRVRCYRYAANDDTVKPAKSIRSGGTCRNRTGAGVATFERQF